MADERARSALLEAINEHFNATDYNGADEIAADFLRVFAEHSVGFIDTRTHVAVPIADDEAMVEAVAAAVYSLDPAYEPGESVDGFRVSPGGDLSWSQIDGFANEFPDGPWAEHVADCRNIARAALAAMRAHAAKADPSP